MAKWHKYKALLRPVSTYTLPYGVKWDFVEVPRNFKGNRPELPASDTPFGIIRIDRELTADERDHFGMQEV